MNLTWRVISTVVMACLCCVMVAARSVFRHHVFLSQPDGSVLEAWISGDEYSHIVVDASGGHIEQDDSGWWRDVPLVVKTSSKRAALSNRAWMRMASATAGAEKKHSVVLLVEFSDKKMSASRDDFVRLLTERGYSEGGAVGSAADYFEDQLGAECEIGFQVSDVIELSGKCADYFSNADDGSDANAGAAVAEACTKAAQSATYPIDFSMADDDGDGEVDNVFLFVAGKDEADGGGKDCPWSHMSYLQYTSSGGLQLGGKTINNYALTTELRMLEDGTFSFTGIGTFCHEFSHSLGLVDMYDTDYSGSGGYGSGLWRTTNLMDAGNQNGDYDIPPHYSAVEYDCLGIGSPEELHTGEYTLEPISVDRRYLRMETGVEGEYFLIENRGAGKWDAEIGGKGLLIYHIDKSANSAGRSDSKGGTLTAAQRWQCNEVNCRPARQCAALVAATPSLIAYASDGTFSGNQSLAFWPQEDSRDYTPLTEPAFVFNDDSDSPFAITGITMDGDNVRFTVVEYGDVKLPSVVLGDTRIYQDAAIIQWEAEDSEFEGSSFISWNESGGEPSVVEVPPYETGKYAIVLEDLSPMTAYATTLYFEVAGVRSREASVNFTTKRLYDGPPFIFLNNVSRNEDGSFPVGAALPLRVYNHSEVASVSWTYDGVPISVGADGFYHVMESGVLRAEISYADGDDDVIIKEVTVK